MAPDSSPLSELRARLEGPSEPERIASAYELAALARAEPAALATLRRSLLGGDEPAAQASHGHVFR